MKIVFITLGFAPVRASGLDISAERLVGQLLAAGHEVAVIAGAKHHESESLHDPRLTIHRLPLGRSNWIGYVYRAAQLVRSLTRTQPVDVVHFWDVHFAFAYSGRYVASLHQSFRQRWVAWDRQRRPGLAAAYRWAYYSSARVLAEQPGLRRAAGLLAVSMATRDEFIRHYNVSPDRIALARHGIDTQFFAPRPASAPLRSQFGLGPDEPVILFAGFATPRKGLDYLAEALPLIRPRPRLVIVGRWGARFRSQFLQLLGPAAQQIIEVGFVPDEQMPDLYGLANVYVSPSLLEGFGLPLAEALACGTPVVAANAGSVPEVVGPGGILVSPANPVELAKAVSDLLADPERSRELGRLGRQHILQEFSLEKMCADTVAGYRQFVTGL
jgi:glycosyltransferase involved in cell wall biosynthesis